MGFLKPKIPWPNSLTLCSSKALSFSQCFAERPKTLLCLSLLLGAINPKPLSLSLEDSIEGGLSFLFSLFLSFSFQKHFFVSILWMLLASDISILLVVSTRFFSFCTKIKKLEFYKLKSCSSCFIFLNNLTNSLLSLMGLFICF